MNFETEWERCKPWIEAALEYGGGTHTIDDVKAMVERREARFWAGVNAAVVTEVQEHPRAKVLYLWLSGGDLDEMLHELRPFVESWAIEQGCTKIVSAGRAGWDRMMAPFGYQPVARICMKELDL